MLEESDKTFLFCLCVSLTIRLAVVSPAAAATQHKHIRSHQITSDHICSSDQILDRQTDTAQLTTRLGFLSYSSTGRDSVLCSAAGFVQFSSVSRREIFSPGQPSLAGRRADWSRGRSSTITDFSLFAGELSI